MFGLQLFKKSFKHPLKTFCDVVFGRHVSTIKLQQYYESVAPLAIALDLISETGAQIRPYLFNSVTNQFIKGDNDLLTQLQNPNSDKTWEDLYKFTSLNRKLQGNTYWMATGVNPKQPFKELFCIHPDVVSVVESNSDYFADRYIITQNNFSTTFEREETADLGIRYYDPMGNELWHIKRQTSRTSQVEGDSVVLAIRHELEQYLAASTHNTSLLKNGMTATSFITPKEGLNSAQRKELAEGIREFYSGDENAGRSLVTNGIEKIDNIGISNKDMDFLNLQKRNENAIYNRLHIPLPLVSGDNMTLANMATAQHQLIDLAVLPELRSILNELTLFIGHRYNLGEFVLFYDENEIGPIIERNIRTSREQASIGVLTINEVRGGLGFEPLVGGDVLLGPASNVPIAQDVFTDDEPKPDKKLFEKSMSALGLTNDDIVKIAYDAGL